MANISQINLPDGNVYDLKDNISGYTKNGIVEGGMNLSGGTPSNFWLNIQGDRLSPSQPIYNLGFDLINNGSALKSYGINVNRSTDGGQSWTTLGTIGAKTSVTISRNLTSGTKSATITVDGTGYDLYAPTNTDTKLQVAAITNGTTYYPIVGTGATAATRQYDTTGMKYVSVAGTATAMGDATLTLGNSTASGTAGNKQGKMTLYGSTAYAHTISGAPTENRALTLPDKAGTIALTSDIPVVDSALSSTSTNPVQNKVINAALNSNNHDVGYLSLYPYVNGSERGIELFAEGDSDDNGRIISQQTIAAATVSVNGLMSASDKAKLDGLIDTLYPVGSVYVTSTNSAPTFGGTWTLFDKVFKYQWITSGFTFNTTNTSEGAFVAILHDHVIEIRITYRNKVAISDSDIPIGTMPYSAVGISSVNGWHANYLVGICDGCNAVGMFAFSATSGSTSTTLTCYDWATRAASFPTTTNAQVNISQVVSTLRPEYMMDSFCDRFYWKRTA